jgi:hypothetical protein
MRKLFGWIVSYARELKEDVKARRRGEVRVVPRGHGNKGRVYERVQTPEGEAAEGRFLFSSRGKPVATLTMKITRANGDVEIIKVPATATVLRSK